MSCEIIPYDFCVKRGQSETRQLTIEDEISGLPIDITGYTFASQIKTNYSDTTPLETISCTITDAPNGIMTLSLNSTQTDALNEGNYYFDVKMTDLSTYVTFIVEGTVIVAPRVTG